MYGGSETRQHPAGDILEAFAGTPQHVKIPSETIKTISIADLVVQIALFSSRGEPRVTFCLGQNLISYTSAQVKQAIQNGGLTVNGVKVDNLNASLSASDLLDGSVAVVSAGKRAIKVIEVV